MTVNELIAELEVLSAKGRGGLDVAVIDTDGCPLDIREVKMVRRYKVEPKVWITCD